MIESISVHPDFQTATPWTMNALASGTEDIVADSGQTIGAVTSQTVTSASYTNVTVTYVAGANYNSDISYYTSSQTYIYGKNTYVQVIPDLTCSTSGGTSITYSLASYNGNAIPAWITINSSTGQLSITTPSPSTNTDYSFYISSTISGVSSAVYKLMTISISGCTTSNWLICQSTDVSTWTTCNSGYTLSSGQWSINSSSQNTPSSQNSPSSSINDNENLKIDSEVSKNFVITAFIVSCVALVVSNILFSTSMSSIWVMINQVQLYFLLFLTRAFIPDQIKNVIIGMDFWLNPFDTIPLFNPKFYGELLSKLYFKVDNPELSNFKINSASTIYNAFSIISWFIFTAILHIIFYVLHRSSSSWRIEGRWAKLKRLLKYIFKKIFEILTFAIYIRYILELSQFFMVSSISEIYSFDTSGYLKIISVVFAIIVLAFFAIVTVFLFLFAFSSYKEIEGEHNKLSELISGLKPNRKERFYVAILMTRRLIFIMVLIFSYSFSSQIVIGMLIAFQAPYLIYIFLIRPFKEMDTTIIELANELIFIVLLITLIILNSERDWTPLIAHIYMQAICFSSFISSVIVAGKFY